MTRIAFLLPDFRGGGAERVALTVIKHLAAEGHAIDLLLCRAEGSLLAELPAAVHIVDFNVGRFRSAIRPLSSYLDRSRPDALHVSMWPLTAIAVVARALSSHQCRLILSDHSVLTSAGYNSTVRQRLIRGVSVRWLYSRADRCVAVSDGVKRNLVALGGPAHKIDVIHNPIDDHWRRIANQPEWPPGSTRLLSVGNLVEAKNHALLLEAVAIVSRERDICLVICGEGHLRSDLERRIEALGLQDKIALPGFRGELGAYYQTADLFVLSSDREGYSLVLAEAMAAGLGIVSTDCPTGPRELLDHGRFGMLAECGSPTSLAQAIVTALDRPFDPGTQRARSAELESHSIDKYRRLLCGSGHGCADE